MPEDYGISWFLDFNNLTYIYFLICFSSVEVEDRAGGRS